MNNVMRKAADQVFQPNNTDIRKLAFELWKESGRPPGKDLEFWLRAQALINGNVKSQALNPATTSEGGRRQHSFIGGSPNR
jgi:hypothetical protein